MYNIDNPEENNKELYKRVIKLFNEVEIGGNIVESVKRIGKNIGKRPVIVTLSSQKLKKKVFEKAEILNEKFGITVASDTSKEERLEYNRLKTIREDLKKYNVEGKIFNSKIKIGEKLCNYDEAVKILERVKKQHDEEKGSESRIVKENQQKNQQGQNVKKRPASSSPMISNYFITKKIKDTGASTQDSQVENNLEIAMSE